MKYLSVLLIACGQPYVAEIPKGDVQLGSCVIPAASLCINITGVQPDPVILDKGSTNDICTNIYGGFYDQTPCDKTGEIGMCTFPPEDDIQYVYVFYDFSGLTADDVRKICSDNGGTYSFQ